MNTRTQKHCRSIFNGAGTIFGLLGLGLFAAGCQHTGGLKGQANTRDEEKLPPVISFIDNPRHVREGITYPPEAAKQAFYWTNEEAEWRIKLPPNGYAYAGFHFFKPPPLQGHHQQYALRMIIAPASAARHLWIGLVSGFYSETKSQLELPLADYPARKRSKDAVEIVIPLREFAEAGSVPLINEGSDPEVALPVNWGDLCELRLINPGGRRSDREIVVTGLELVRQSSSPSPGVVRRPNKNTLAMRGLQNMIPRNE